MRAVNVETGKLVLKIPYFLLEPREPQPGVFLSVPLAGEDEWFVLHEQELAVRLSRFSWPRAREMFTKGEVTVKTCQTWETEFFKCRQAPS